MTTFLAILHIVAVFPVVYTGGSGFNQVALTPWADKSTAQP